MGEYGQVLKAVSFAAEKHRDQRRKDEAQTPYINHPIAVAETLRIFGIVDDVDVLVAALLHDVLEDTETTPGEILESFGSDVLTIVQEVTDDKSFPKQARKDLQIAGAPRLSEQARWVKLADKICNLSDMAKNPPVGWPMERCVAYVDWCEAVIAGVRGTHVGLEGRFDDVCESARNAFKVE
ncbi:MAG: bifunctional (p)ppGpp synthetase/guanosine-3',5'-bis(diphosphate) 3'-pyrophosphohydrolase [Candidatus Latescibacteria bacterium]|jgi:GTP diphosphokinase / guanosine-3',5'-bis(diphosphate) 3'-diphosphatase|nr:bifunctional (p)ppGpp synthetase/guanosine-3',5'-bis(diphosphate) 3'-pyrophosphohydrolase [Candidatus Latescibacterota bacterium]MBT4136723.1 bifunctional (p)ppGpp synthetase/guanosine-3',5'-bis(diphosphate) 3'-pyrophosphohydrolase [Candidatus Latescibacterota bacterium]